MQQNFDPVFLFSFVSSIVGVLVSIILVLSNKGQSFSSRILAFILFSLSFTLMNYACAISGMFIVFPFLYRSAVFFTMAIPSLTYIYARVIIKQEYTFRKGDIVFLIIAIAYTMKFLPVYMMGGENKQEIVKKAFSDNNYFARELDGWLPGGWAIIARMIYSLILVSSVLHLILKWNLRPKDSSIVKEQNKAIYKWLLYLVSVILLTYLCLIPEYIFQISRILNIHWIMSVTVAFAIFFISFYLLFKPQILYGASGWEGRSVDTDIYIASTHDIKVKEDNKSKLSYEQGVKLHKILNEHFEVNQPFLKPGYTIGDLAKETAIPSHLWSAFINQEYVKNFNEFINDYRLEHLEKLLKKDSTQRQYTLEGLGKMVGFKSRTTFIASVKRKTGKTPSEVFSIKSDIGKES
jgi:AraC-like DNA-binding protein